MLYRKLPYESQAQRDLAVALTSIGNFRQEQAGDPQGALEFFNRALEVSKKILTRDENSARAQRDLLVSYSDIAGAKRQSNDREGSLAAYLKALQFAKVLSERKGGGIQALSDLLDILRSVAEAKFDCSDPAGAVAAHQAALDITRDRLSKEPKNRNIQRALTASLTNFASMKHRVGDDLGSLAAYDEALDFARKLSKTSNDSALQFDLIVVLADSGLIMKEGNERIQEAIFLAEAMRRSAKLPPAGKRLMQKLVGHAKAN